MNIGIIGEPDGDPCTAPTLIAVGVDIDSASTASHGATTTTAAPISGTVPTANSPGATADPSNGTAFRANVATAIAAVANGHSVVATVATNHPAVTAIGREP